MNEIEWVKGYTARGAGPTPRTQRASYSLRGLAERGLLPQGDVNRMLFDADLRDFGWDVIWGEDYDTADADLPDRIGNVEGYMVWVHGWTGTRYIFEDMPGMVINRNRRLASVVVDHDGFGHTPFADRTPEYDECSPAGAMRALDRWLRLLNLRRGLGDPTPKVVNFIGHSLGGAALFFLKEPEWRLGEQTRTALAPALLLDDDQGRNFFTTLGLGIGLVGRLSFLEGIEKRVSPVILDTLVNGATGYVRGEHRRVYDATPRSVTARVLAAMGTIRDEPMTHKWDYMSVFLAHKDVLVGLLPTMDMLYRLNFDVPQVKVVMGTHYFFSVGDDWARVHAQNREMVVENAMSLHGQAFKKQKTG
jgi:hypothetical protein